MPTDHVTNLSGINFHYVAWGQDKLGQDKWRGEGVPIILIHGLASTLHIWDLVAPRLTAQGQVWALDQRGHGLTSQPATGYDFATICQDLLNFINALGIRQRFFLAGHSWGAYTALAFAHIHSDLLYGAILVDGGITDHKSQSPTWEIAEARMRPPAMIGQTVLQVQAMIKEQWLGSAWTPETGAMAFQCYKVDEHGFVDRRLHLANHMQIARAIWEMTPADLFAQIKCPVLLTVPIPSGEPDAWQLDKQQQVRNAAALIPDCQLVWFPNSIHDLPWQRPALLAETINHFIETHSPKGKKP